MAVSGKNHSIDSNSDYSYVFLSFSSHSEIDANQKSGVSPEKVADDIYRAVLADQKDIVLAPIHHIAIQWLRLICPPIYYFAMEKQARRSKPTAE